jgi:hypothetical protein
MVLNKDFKEFIESLNANKEHFSTGHFLIDLKMSKNYSFDAPRPKHSNVANSSKFVTQSVTNLSFHAERGTRLQAN